MSVVDEIVKNMMKEIDPLGEGNYGEVLIDEWLFDVPPLEEFLSVGPDVVENIESVLQTGQHYLLGLYSPMRSPGQVILFSGNLRNFFWGLVRKIIVQVPMISKFDLGAGARMVTTKTYYHELFHFDCDIQRHLYGGSWDPLLEEALAVAWARRRVMEDRQKWQSQIGRMNGVFFNLLMRDAFRYTSPGYRDWVSYSDDSSFKEGLLEYVKPGNYQGLRSNGVPVEEIVFGSLGMIRTGYQEKCI